MSRSLGMNNTVLLVGKHIGTCCISRAYQLSLAVPRG